MRHLLVSVLLVQLDFGAVTDIQALTEANRWLSPPLFQPQLTICLPVKGNLKRFVLLSFEKGACVRSEGDAMAAAE